MCLGQLVNVATGFAATILLMVGESGQLTWAVGAGAAVNLALSAALIPSYGATGAAVATAASTATMNILMAYLLWRRQRIYSAVLWVGHRRVAAVVVSAATRIPGFATSRTDRRSRPGVVHPGLEAYRAYVSDKKTP